MKKIEEHGAQICIPDKVNFKMKPPLPLTFTNDVISSRDPFSALKIFATFFRFDKWAVCFLNFVLLVSIIIHF